MQKQGEGYNSIEEYMQERMELFLWLQAEEEGKERELFWEKAEKMQERVQRTVFFLPPEYVRQCYQLTDTEYWLVLYAFACELERGLCLDFQKKHTGNMPSLQYALHLLSQVLPVDFLLIAELYREKGRLAELLKLSGDQGALLQPLCMNRTAFFFLLTGSLEDWDWGYLWEPAGDLQEEQEADFLPLHEEAFFRICRFMEAFPSFCIRLYGLRGSGKRTLLKRVCMKRKSLLVFLSVKSILERKQEEQQAVFAKLRLIQRLADPVFALDFREQTEQKTEEAEEFVASFQKNCENCKMFFLTETESDFHSMERFADTYVELKDMLSVQEKELLWKTCVPEEDRREWQQAFIRRYRMNIGEWEEKRREITFLAASSRKNLSDPELWKLVLQRKTGAWTFGTLVEKEWEEKDLVLSQECRKQLNTVMEIAAGWQAGQGLRLLFHGSSGTGKTMTASILAKHLGLPLFKVELSNVVDKYVGETEKHLDEIFHTAQKNNFLLFFDEADALFTKRTAVQNSNDKYANASTAYLLQRMEAYEGILILATNLVNHFDNAFARRIQYVVKFSGLDEEGRVKLWEKSFAGGPDLEEGITFRELARAAAFSPARICAAADTARMLARQRRTDVITKDQLLEAMELEAVKDDMPLKKF